MTEASAASRGDDTDGRLEFDHETRELLVNVAEQLTDDAQDTLLLIARSVADADDATHVRLVEIDPYGVDLEVTGADGDVRTERIHHDQPSDDVSELEAGLWRLVDRARAARPNEPLTSMEQARETAAKQQLHHTTVTEVADLSPRLRSITVGPLEGFRSLGWDQTVSLLVERPGRPIPDELTHAEWIEMDQEVAPQARTYTVRSWDPATRELELWVVQHGDDPMTISSWVGDAEVGTPAVVFGPRGRFAVPDDTDRALLVVDETAFGAAAAIIEQLPERFVEVTVVAEVDDTGTEIAFPDRDGLDVQFVHRGEDAPGTGGHLERHVRAMDVDPDGLFAFGAAEASQVMAVRRHLRNELGVAGGHLTMGGYWRRGHVH